MAGAELLQFTTMWEVCWLLEKKEDIQIAMRSTGSGFRSVDREDI